ncbi:MAG: protein phosphatase 2C domain-containing protein [Egibacteraceae bacterium]
MSVTFASAAGLGKACNEDLCGAGTKAAWVLDGASVPPGIATCCERDAVWYVHRLADALSSCLAAQPPADLRNVLADAIDAVRREHEATCRRGSGHALGPSATVALVRRQEQVLDYLVLGDTAVLLDTGDDVICHSDRRLAQVAAPIREEIYRRLRRGGGYDSSTHRSLVNRLIEYERMARNTLGGYWTASDDPAAAFQAITGSYQIGQRPGEVRRLALLTDGAQRAVTHFGTHGSWSALMTALVADGPQACIQTVRAAEAVDPDGRRFLRTQPSDDATVLIWDLTRTPDYLGSS